MKDTEHSCVEEKADSNTRRHTSSITHLKPWLLPKQRDGASDLDKRRHAIIHVNRLQHKET